MIDIANSVEMVVARHRALKQPTEVCFLGHSFLMQPGVFSPFIAPSGYLELSFAGWPVFQDKTVLDMGSGSGVASCLFALNGAKEVLGVDINPRAISAGKANAQRIGVADRVSFVCGDVFDPVPEHRRFDVIFCNLPFVSGQPRDSLDQAFYDPELSSLKRFIRGFRRRAKSSPETVAFVCLSDLGGAELEGTASSIGLEWREAMRIDLHWIGLRLIGLALPGVAWPECFA